MKRRILLFKIKLPKIHRKLQQSTWLEIFLNNNFSHCLALSINILRNYFRKISLMSHDTDEELGKYPSCVFLWFGKNASMNPVELNSRITWNTCSFAPFLFCLDQDSYYLLNGIIVKLHKFMAFFPHKI